MDGNLQMKQLLAFLDGVFAKDHDYTTYYPEYSCRRAYWRGAAFGESVRFWRRK